MKKVDATIQHFKLDAVKKALLEKGIEGMTITEVHNVGEESQTITYRGTDKVIDSIPKVRVETIVSDRVVDEVIDAVFQAAHTGNPGDGRIIVTNIESMTRIRTGETDETDNDFIGHSAEVLSRMTALHTVASPFFQHSV